MPPLCSDLNFEFLEAEWLKFGRRFCLCSSQPALARLFCSSVHLRRNHPAHRLRRCQAHRFVHERGHRCIRQRQPDRSSKLGNGPYWIPFSILGIEWILTTAINGVQPLAVKWLYLQNKRHPGIKTQIAIYGAGEAGLARKRGHRSRIG